MPRSHAPANRAPRSAAWRPLRRPHRPGRRDGTGRLASGLLAICALTSGCGRPDEAPTPTPTAPTTGTSAPDPTTAPAFEPPAPANAPTLADFTGVVLPDVAAARGLVHTNVSGRPDTPTILEANGAGVALLDLESDGDLDIVVAQGCASLAALLDGPGARLAVFLNDGDGRFEPAPAPEPRGWWTGLATGDLNGDGLTDLVAGGFGQAVVLLQQPDGSLVAVDEPGLIGAGSARLVPGAPREAGAPPDWITSLALFDADRDGHLDLYVGRYLDLDPVDPPIGELGEGLLALPCEWKGLAVYCGPRGMTAQSDRLLLGRGDGTFADASDRLGDIEAAFTLGVVPFDADGDGDSDLYVAADSVPNQLLVNDGSGRFSDHAVGAGVAVNSEGMAEAGMGVATGDLDRDGRVDLVVTNFSDEATQLFLGAEVGFRAATYRSGLQSRTRRLLSWGVHLVDLDADGRLELFTANGHVYPQADAPNTGTSYAQPDTLWRFDEQVRARDVAPGGDASILAAVRGSRGSAVGDLDGDGAPELVVSTIAGPLMLGHNTFARHQHRVELRLEGAGPDADAPGPRSPRDGHGARVLVVPSLPPEAQFGVLREVQTASGYQSASSPFIHAGLGAATAYEQIQVLWPSGAVDTLPAGPGGRRLFVREGEGVVKSEELER